MMPRKKFKVHSEIKGRLRSVGRTQTDLAIKLQMSYDTLGHFINGRRVMPEKVKIKIGKILESWEHVQV